MQRFPQPATEARSASRFARDAYEFVTLPEAARLLDLSEDTVRRWIHVGELPAVRVGLGAGRFRIRVGDLERLVSDA